MAVQIKLDKFEGPLDLLLELIEKEKLNITEISLAKVTDQFLEYVRLMKKIEPVLLADFLVVAARLILIKSRMLLPTLDISQEEEEGIEELKSRLAEYQKFKNAARLLAELDRENKTMHAREAFAKINPFFYPPEKLKVQEFKKIMGNVIRSLPKFEPLETKILGKIASVEEKIKEISRNLEKGLSNFGALAEKSKDKIDLIITFLALLELVRQKAVKVTQSGKFDDISIKKMTI
jgi:segregation and condensation protein A